MKALVMLQGARLSGWLRCVRRVRDTDAPVLIAAVVRDAARMGINIKDVIFEFVKQAGPDDICFSSPEGNGYTKPHGRNVRRGDRDSCQICIEYGQGGYITITDDLRQKLTAVPTIPRHGHGNFGKFVYEVEMSKVNSAADLVEKLIAAAAKCNAW